MADNFMVEGSDEEYPNIKSDLDTFRNKLTAEKRVWDLCLLYLQGKQHLTWDRNSKAYTSDRGFSYKAKYTFNLLLNLYRTVISKLQLETPHIAVLPASPSDEDIVKAKSSEEALGYYWSSEGMHDIMHKALTWFVSTGNVGLHTYYDPDDENVHTKVVSPFDIFFEPGVMDYEESQWCAVRSLVTKKQAASLYPDNKSYIEELGTIDNMDLPYSNTDVRPPERLEVYDVYWKDGRYAIMIGSRYVAKGKFSKPIMPVQHIRYTDIPYKLWGVGLVENLLDLQNIYNRTRNQVIENIDLMSHPKWLIPKSAGVSNNAIKGKPGEKIYYNSAGGAPSQIAGSPLPPYVMINIQQLQGEMNDIAGIHSTSMGKRAVGINSAAAIEQLSGQDTSQLAMTQLNIENAIRDLATTVLVLMKEYYTQEKMVRMMDDQGNMIFKAISGTNIVEDAEVHLEAGAIFADNANDRNAKVIQMLQLGLITKEDAVQELSFKTNRGYVLKKIANTAHALDVLEAAKTGAGVELFPSDDLGSFESVFSNFMRTEEFYTMTEEEQNHISTIYMEINRMMQMPNPLEQPRLTLPPGQQGPQGLVPSITGLTGAQSNMQPPGITGRPPVGQTPEQQTEETSARRAEAMLKTPMGGIG